MGVYGILPDADLLSTTAVLDSQGRGTIQHTRFMRCESGTVAVRTRQWSDYRKSLPGDFIRIRLTIKQNCRLFLDIFSSAIMNDLFMTFTSRLI